MFNEVKIWYSCSFSDEGVGTVVGNSGNSPYELGTYYKDFNMEMFEYYNGEITLKND